MQKIRIGVVRGGSNIYGYQKSISDGAIILRGLREHEEYEAYDILIDQDEVWHIDGVPIVPSLIIGRVDIVISTILYPLVKNGYVESLIKSFGIKCIHSPKNALRGYIDEDLKNKIKEVGVKIPEKMELNFDDDDLLKKIHQNFSPPYSLVGQDILGFVKHFANLKTVNEIVDIINNENFGAHKYFIEEYIPGDIWAVTVMPRFRNVLWYTLHPVYLGTINPAFRSAVSISNSAQSSFANPKVREYLDLYSKLVCGAINPSIPITLVFHHIEDKKPVLLRVIDRHILEDEVELLTALKESVVPHTEYLDKIIKGYL